MLWRCLRLGTAAGRGAVVRRQDQEHLRADACAEEEEEKLIELREEEIRDSDSVAEAEELAESEGEPHAESHPDANRNEHAQAICVADRVARTFSNAKPHELPFADA